MPVYLKNNTFNLKFPLIFHINSVLSLASRNVLLQHHHHHHHHHHHRHKEQEIKSLQTYGILLFGA